MTYFLERRSERSLAKAEQEVRITEKGTISNLLNLRYKTSSDLDYNVNRQSRDASYQFSIECIKNFPSKRAITWVKNREADKSIINENHKLGS